MGWPIKTEYFDAKFVSSDIAGVRKDGDKMLKRQLTKCVNRESNPELGHHLMGRPNVTATPSTLVHWLEMTAITS